MIHTPPQKLHEIMHPQYTLGLATSQPLEAEAFLSLWRVKEHMTAGQENDTRDIAR